MSLNHETAAMFVFPNQSCSQDSFGPWKLKHFFRPKQNYIAAGHMSKKLCIPSKFAKAISAVSNIFTMCFDLTSTVIT